MTKVMCHQWRMPCEISDELLCARLDLAASGIFRLLVHPAAAGMCNCRSAPCMLRHRAHVRSSACLFMSAHLNTLPGRTGALLVRPSGCRGHANPKAL